MGQSPELLKIAGERVSIDDLKETLKSLPCLPSDAPAHRALLKRNVKDLASLKGLNVNSTQ